MLILAMIGGLTIICWFVRAIGLRQISFEFGEKPGIRRTSTSLKERESTKAAWVSISSSSCSPPGGLQQVLSQDFHGIHDFHLWRIWSNRHRATM
jgi:hypothetical protein